MSPTNHFVFISSNGVSHLRLLLQLALNLLDLHPSLIITFIISDRIAEKYESEYGLQPTSLVNRVQARFRPEIISTAFTGSKQQEEASGSKVLHSMDANKRYNQGLADAVQGLISGTRQGRWATMPCGFAVDVSHPGPDMRATSETI